MNHLRTPASISVSHFCLIEYIRSFAQPEVASQMAQGVAWKIDTMLQQASREIFRNVRQDLYRKGVDGLAELSIALRESAFAAESFKDAGSHSLGAVTQIGELMYFREAAHGMAADLTALCTDWNGRPLTYVTPDLDDVFHAEVNMKLKPLTVRRLTMSTERHAKAYDLTAEEVKAQVAKKIERKNMQLKDVGITLQDQAGAVYELFNEACKASTFKAGDEFNFWNMSTDTQRALIEHAKANADRAEDRATDNSNLTDSEYDDISMSVLTANKDLSSVLKSPRFVIAAQVADAG